jgi:hypothetical protein
MGYMIATGHCIGCKQLFSFNPLRVPSSSAITGQREPICPACVDRINNVRKEKGLPKVVPAPDAYEPIEEHEL